MEGASQPKHLGSTFGVSFWLSVGKVEGGSTGPSVINGEESGTGKSRDGQQTEVAAESGLQGSDKQDVVLRGVGPILEAFWPRPIRSPSTHGVRDIPQRKFNCFFGN